MFKTIILLTFLIFRSHAEATPVLLAPGANPKSYKTTLQANPNLTSIVEFYRKKAQVAGPKEESLFSLADDLSLPTPSLIAQMKSLHEGQRLSATGVLFIRDFIDKISSRSFSKLERNEIDSLYCMGESLVADRISRCKFSQLTSHELKKRFPWADGLVIEYKFFDLSETESIQLDKIANYHFQILSHTHKVQDFYGSIEQLLQQNFSPDTWVSGACDGFTSAVDDFSLSQEALAYFSPECLKAVKNPPTDTSTQKWVQKNKPWLYTAGAMILGGIAYSLKDKKMVINTSAFK